MIKNTVFIDLKGNIGDYIKVIRTNSITTDTQLKSLQKELNGIITNYIKKQATAANCYYLWNELTTTFKAANIKHKEYEVYKELVSIIDGIGERIAYLCKRKGYKPRGITYCNCYTEEEIADAVKKLLLDKFATDELDYREFMYKTDTEIYEWYNGLKRYKKVV